jgi:ComF family protein
LSLGRARLLVNHLGVRSVRVALQLIGTTFAPMRCAGCDAVVGDPICVCCLRALETIPAPPVKRMEGGGICIAAFEYRDPLRSIIHRVKYRARKPALLGLASLAAVRISQRHLMQADAMIAVPLGPRRLRQRGYNQAELVARSLAALHGPPVLPGLARVRDTRPQAEQNGSARWRNVEGAFAWRGGSLAGTHLWLVDDVVTTGATASAAVVALRSAGAARVDVVALAAVP